MAANLQVSNVGTRVDLQLRTGADFLTTLTFTNADGSPVNLAGVGLAAQLRKLPLDAAIVASFTLSIRSPASAGLVDVHMPASVTAAIPCANSLLDGDSRYAWDLKFTDATGAISTPLFGAVRIAAATTR